MISRATQDERERRREVSGTTPPRSDRWTRFCAAPLALARSQLRTWRSEEEELDWKVGRRGGHATAPHDQICDLFPRSLAGPSIRTRQPHLGRGIPEREGQLGPVCRTSSCSIWQAGGRPRACACA